MNQPFSTFLHRTVFFIFLTIGWISCSPDPVVDHFTKVKDDDVRELLQKAMRAAGGLDNWYNKRALSFKKYFALYDSTGATENAVKQLHHYQYQPDELIQYTWEQAGATHQVSYSNGTADKTIDGQIDPTAQPAATYNAVMSATFVLSIPFNFLDEGATLSYEGTTTLEDGTEVEVLKIIYDPSQHDNLTTADIWWVYFDKQDHRLLAYMVQHADHYSYVRNVSLQEAGGFLFPKERKSWRVNPDRSIQYLRAEYVYSDFEVK